MSMKRIVISKSAKKKMSSPHRQKADGYTEEVVYHTVNSKGKKVSRTHHELRAKD